MFLAPCSSFWRTQFFLFRYFFLTDYLVLASNKSILYQWNNSTKSLQNLTVSYFNVHLLLVYQNAGITVSVSHCAVFLIPLRLLFFNFLLLLSIHAKFALKPSKVPNHLLSNASTTKSLLARLALAPLVYDQSCLTRLLPIIFPSTNQCSFISSSATPSSKAIFFLGQFFYLKFQPE